VDLDLYVTRVLTRMHGSTGRDARDSDRLGKLGQRLDAKLRQLRRGGFGGDDDRRKKMKSSVNDSPWQSIYKGPTGSTHCASFYTKELAPTRSISLHFLPNNIHSTNSLATYTLSLGREYDNNIRSSW
jgi:hypothetical protein